MVSPVRDDFIIRNDSEAPIINDIWVEPVQSSLPGLLTF